MKGIIKGGGECMLHTYNKGWILESRRYSPRNPKVICDPIINMLIGFTIEPIRFYGLF